MFMRVAVHLASDFTPLSQRRHIKSGTPPKRSTGFRFSEHKSANNTSTANYCLMMRRGSTRVRRSPYDGFSSTVEQEIKIRGPD